MTFLQLLDGAEVLYQSGDPIVTGVQYDSRRVGKGDAFVAMRGESTDGNRFIDRAIAQGAVAVVTDSADEKPRPGFAWAQVPHGRRALARIAANFYHHPAEKLSLVGITGTNGKTTTTFLVESIFEAAGRKSALVGTIEYHVAGRSVPAPHTTPESLELNQVYAEAVSDGAADAVMEVSSHALAQERVFGIPFDVAVFTNLTRDHLDFHRSMDEYYTAKRGLFEGCGTEPPRVSVINIEDEYGSRLARESKSAEKIAYGIERGEFHAANVDIRPSGTRFDMLIGSEAVPIFTPLLGRVNVYNALAAAAAAWARGCTGDAIARGIESRRSVPGRFERVDCGQPFQVVVDYAHTDAALRNVSALARSLVGSGGRVITVFGCGGDRDRSKRPLMGEAAGRGSDFVVLTSDNPRSEDPMAIINDAKSGLEQTGTRFAIEPDRRNAIAAAVGAAKPGDIVVIAGKGHEKVQVTRAGASPFDDVEVAREVLRSNGHDPSLVTAQTEGRR
ncbi:MAG: UDP-N-acetylmuramoyl-L-alanyl-D-glutamate--2,6-diaminopimelate ligase [Acidobacteria bacterium]|nr:UDP-N-acetylmuramoyl-L-alanyl-D-glutamate--2,6-diaminopimelate ligase [Acidobacteriota bacterium]